MEVAQLGGLQAEGSERPDEVSDRVESLRQSPPANGRGFVHRGAVEIGAAAHDRGEELLLLICVPSPAVSG